MVLDARRLADLIHREMVQLVLLMTVTVAVFAGTRSLAAATRAAAARDAEKLFQSGQAAKAAGRFDEAVADLRRAVARRRGHRPFVLALADAQVATGDTAAARRELMALRETFPEDPQVSLALARVDAAAGSVDEAQRFYYNALYAPWPADQTEARRSVRLELIRFLAAHDRVSRALSELIAVDADVPTDAAHQKEIAALYVRMGDRRRALEHFQRAVASDPADAGARAGAGLAAFHLGDYELASRYLRQTPDTSGEVAEAREVVALLLSNDPLAPHLGTAERRRRLNTVLAHARERLASCAAMPDAAAALPDVTGTRTLDQDAIENALEAVARAEAVAGRRCGPPAPLDAALSLMARLHGTVPQ